MKIKLPKLGLTMTEATPARWGKAEGETVSQGEMLFEFESDKSLLEFECPVDGVLAQILVAEGETVSCGTPVAILEVASEQESREAREQGSKGVERQERVAQTQAQPLNSQSSKLPNSILATPAAKRHARELELELTALSERGPNGRVQLADVEAALQLKSTAKPVTMPLVTATPMAKQLAQDLAVDLGQVKGSGSGGRVVKDDILQAAVQMPTVSHPYESQPLSGIRQLIAQRMSDSAFTAPHVTLFTEANATALVDVRQQLNTELNNIAKISYNTLLIALAARALRQYPTSG